LPAFDLYESVPVTLTEGEVVRREWAPNVYLSGRQIGDEYRYILDRRYATRYPGNLLDRPGLLLNPWELRSTTAEIDELQVGEDYQPVDALERSQRGSQTEEFMKRIAE